MESVMQNELLLRTLLEEALLKSRTIPQDEDLGLLMAEICSRSGRVSEAWAKRMVGFNPQAIRAMLLEQMALSAKALMLFDQRG